MSKRDYTSMLHQTKAARAPAIRDAAFALIKTRGHAPPEGFLPLGYVGASTTTGNLSLSWHKDTAGENVVDVWAPLNGGRLKVFSARWDDTGSFRTITFRAGDWERELDTPGKSKVYH
jgi:hypothetical protein